MAAEKLYRNNTKHSDRASNSSTRSGLGIKSRRKRSHTQRSTRSYSSRSTKSYRKSHSQKGSKNEPGKEETRTLLLVIIILAFLLFLSLVSNHGRAFVEFFGFGPKKEEDLITRITSGDRIFGKNASPLTQMQKKQLASAMIGYLGFISSMLILWITMMGIVKTLHSHGDNNWDKYSGDDKVGFSDIAGQDEAKKELIEVVEFLKNPAKYEALGAKVPKGVLLEGPPGTGKTLLARACANEANVPFFSSSGSQFVEKFVGVGAARVRELFKNARENGPSICFIDEFDSVGGKRSGAFLNSEKEQTVNQLLAEMDGFKKSAVIVIAATNRASDLDEALLRPGRFDRHITVGLPDAKGRHEILKLHTKGKPLSKDVDMEALAHTAVGFSGADLAHICNEAALMAAVDSRKKIHHSNFTLALERKMLGIKRPPIQLEHDRKITAYHESGHALVAILTPGASKVFKVTMTPRGRTMGVTAFTPSESLLYSRKALLAQICVALGGRVAEEIIFDDVTVGAVDDLRRVTDLATRMVTQFGMSKNIGQLSYEDNRSREFGMSEKPYSEETAARIDKETKHLVDKMYERTKILLTKNVGKLHKLAKALLKHEILEKADVVKLLKLKDY